MFEVHSEKDLVYTDRPRVTTQKKGLQLNVDPQD